MTAGPLTVAVCTWNRARALARLFASLERLEIPPGRRWELLVVDNNSTDDTARVIASFKDRLPLTALFEPRQGKSYALNTLIRRAAGEWIFWLDDDQAPPPDWLTCHLAGIERRPECDFFGGPIRPEFEVPPPRWITGAWRSLRGAYGELDFGPEPCDLEPRQLASGGNFVIRTAVQREFAYDTRLGRTTADFIGGEESDVQLRMLAAGRRGGWNPGTPMRHFIEPARMSFAHVRKYFRGTGLALACIRRKEGRDLPVAERARLRGRIVVRRIKFGLFLALGLWDRAARALARTEFDLGLLGIGRTGKTLEFAPSPEPVSKA